MIWAILEEYAGVIALAIAIVLAGSVIGYALYTINNVGIMNVKYAMLLPWAYAYYNNDRIVLWVTNPGLISFQVEKVIADNGLVLLNRPIGPVAPNNYIVLTFPYVETCVKKTPIARIYKIWLNIVLKSNGHCGVIDRAIILAESYYASNSTVIKIVKVVNTSGYVHYFQYLKDRITLLFEDCSCCDFNYRDLVLKIVNLGKTLVLVQEEEGGDYPHWLYINGTLVNYKPPYKTQQGKTWTFNLKLIVTKYRIKTRRIILYEPHWLTVVACVSGHICKQFTTPIWNITILTQTINETTNITNRKLSWYIPHTYTPPGYATIFISITPPTTPTWTYVKIETPTGTNKTYLITTKYVVLSRHCLTGECYPSGECDLFCAPWSNNEPGEYALAYVRDIKILNIYFLYSIVPDWCYSAHWWIVNNSKLTPIGNNVTLVLTGTLMLTVPIGTRITIYVPKELEGWEVVKPYKIPIDYYYAIGNVRGPVAIYEYSAGEGGIITKHVIYPPKTFTEWTFLGYLGPLVNGLVHRNNITLTINRSGYILILYGPNPNTVNIKIQVKITNIPWDMPIEDELREIPFGEVYYRPPTWTTYKVPTLLIDTINLLTEDTIKAQINSTIIIKCRKTINIIYCKPCPVGKCGHGTCYRIIIQLQGSTIRRIKISNSNKEITIMYKITKIEQITPNTCGPCWKPSNKGGSGYPYWYVIYKPVGLVKFRMKSGKVMVCTVIEKCWLFCKEPHRDCIETNCRIVKYVSCKISS